MRYGWALAVLFSMAVTLHCAAADVVDSTAGLSTSPSNDSYYAIPVFADQAGPGQNLLPVRGVDLPVVTAVDSDMNSRSAPVTTPVEAIPTPTAFRAGSVVLGAIILGRWLRKLRHA